MPIQLPTEPSVPTTEMKGFRWLIHGWPKTGKTCLAAQFPNPLFIQAEVGCKGLSIYGVEVSTWGHIVEAAELLADSEHKFDTVVIDTIDKTYDMICESVADDSGVTDITKVPHGAGFNIVNKKLRTFLDYLDSLHMCTILISHTRIVKDQSTAIEVDRCVPNLGESARNIVVGWSDITIYTYVESHRQIKQEGDYEESLVHKVACTARPGCEAGGRIRYMPRDIILSPTPLDGFNRLEKSFNEACMQMLADMNKKETKKVKGK